MQVNTKCQGQPYLPLGHNTDNLQGTWISKSLNRNHLGWSIKDHWSSFAGKFLHIPWAFLVAQPVRICLQCRRPGFDPWVGKIPWRRNWQSTPVFLPGEFHGQRSPVGYSPWDHKELDMTEQLTHTLHILKGIKWNKSLYLESHRHSLSSCEVFNVWVAAHGKHSHDPVSWDQLEPMSYICSSWGQLFTQTKNSIPKFRLYLCSIINYKKSMATVSFQGHKCYSEELESLRKIIKTHPPCECALLSCWKGLKNWVLPPERTWTQC